MEMKRGESNKGEFFEGEASLEAKTPLNSATPVAQK